MKTLSARQFMEVLVENCPSDSGTRASCADCRLRGEPDVSARRKKLMLMSDSAVDELYRFHGRCLYRGPGVVRKD